jgi:hypothetical protein
MQFRFLNKNFKNKRFDYSPMYYDERKERLEIKKSQYESLNKDGVSDEERKNILRQNMSESWNRSKHAEQQKMSSNMRIAILVLIILGLGYFIFNGVNEVDVVVKKIM